MLTKEYIIRYLMIKLQTGELNIGDKLPSERALSLRLKCHRNTVRDALNYLKSISIIDVNPRSSYIFINSPNDIFLSKNLLIYNSYKSMEISPKKMPLKLLRHLDEQEDKCLKISFFQNNLLAGISYVIIKQFKAVDFKKAHNIMTSLAYYGVIFTNFQEKKQFKKNNYHFELLDKYILETFNIFQSYDKKQKMLTLTFLAANFLKI